MSEMSAEKKKEIENYIIKSYFGGGKNIEAYVNGADLISGSGGIPDLLVEVESFNDEMITVRWDILSEFGSEYKNEFMMVLARERSITRNRCDSVDSMMYAWEAWRSKIQGKPIFLKTNDEDLQKDKCIEELEKEVKALRAEKEVMERHIQELEAHNVSLADTNVVFENELKILTGAIQEWKKVTCCPSPSSARTLIESGASWHHAYNEIKKANEKLADDVKSWKNVTGYSTPEGFLAARINAAIPFDYTAAWQKATGCTTPEQAKERIKALNEGINELEADYNHLLCTTGFGSEGEIEDALDKCDHSTLRKALVDYEFDYENLLKLTGYKSEHDIRVALNYSEQFVYENMRELINSLKRKAKFIDSNWQVATGCNSPEEAKTNMRNLRGKIDEIKEFAAIASNWTDRIVED